MFVFIENESALKEANEKGFLDVLSDIKIKHGYDETLCDVCEHLNEMVNEVNNFDIIFGGCR